MKENSDVRGIYELCFEFACKDPSRDFNLCQEIDYCACDLHAPPPTFVEVTLVEHTLVGFEGLHF